MSPVNYNFNQNIDADIVDYSGAYGFAWKNAHDDEISRAELIWSLSLSLHILS